MMKPIPKQELHYVLVESLQGCDHSRTLESVLPSCGSHYDPLRVVVSSCLCNLTVAQAGVHFNSHRMAICGDVLGLVLTNVDP
jgi:hypothetical protein